MEIGASRITRKKKRKNKRRTRKYTPVATRMRYMMKEKTPILV